jgi:hypothetical protein
MTVFHGVTVQHWRTTNHRGNVAADVDIALTVRGLTLKKASQLEAFAKQVTTFKITIEQEENEDA